MVSSTPFVRWTIIDKGSFRRTEALLDLGGVDYCTSHFDKSPGVHGEPVKENLNCVLVDFDIWDVAQPEVIGMDVNFLTSRSDVGTNSESLPSKTFDRITRIQ